MVFLFKNERRRYKKYEENTSTDFQPSTSVAHLFLFSTSALALKKTSTETPLVFGAFSFLLGHSLLAAKHYGNPCGSSEPIRKLVNLTTVLAQVAPLSLLATELFIKGEFQMPIAYAPTVSVLLPVGVNLASEEKCDCAIDAVNAYSILSLAYANYSTFDNSPWIWGVVALATLNQFVFCKLASSYEVPKMDFVAIQLSFLSIFAINCLCDVK